MATIAFSRTRRLPLALPRLDAAGLLTGATYLIFFAFGFMSFTDPDYWWHLRTGQYIVEQRALPGHDIFSYTVPGKEWLTHEWLSEVLIYLGVTNLGYAITLGVFVAVALGSFGVMQRLMIRRGTPPLAAILLVLVGLMISATYWTVRPQTLSWLFIAVFIASLSGQKRPQWLLVPAMALWANLHLGFLFGLLITGIWLASSIWESWAERGTFNLTRGFVFVAALCAATLVNPSGPAVWTHALPFLPVFGSAVDSEVITEWASPDFHAPIHFPLLAGIILLVLLTAKAHVRDTFAILLAAAFAGLALYSSRFQPLFAIAFLPAAGLAAKDVLASKRSGSTSHGALNWLIIAATALAVLVAIPSLPGAQSGREARTDGRVYYPAPGLAWLQEHQPDANVFATYMWGGYIANALYPEGHVFVDGRADMYGEDVVQDYRRIHSARPGWQEQLEDAGTDVVVVEASSPLALELRYASGWRTVLETDQEAVFARLTSR